LGDRTFDLNKPLVIVSIGDQADHLSKKRKLT